MVEVIERDINIDLDLNLSPIYDKKVEQDVQIVLFKVTYKGLNNAYNQKVCGKTCYEYVKKVCAGFKTVEKEIDSTADPVHEAKSILNTNFKYTAILFSDTPLLRASTFLGALDYARLKNVNMLRLYRGFIFDTSYLMSISNLYLKEPMDYEAQDFKVCKDNKSLYEISNIMQQRIFDYHFENGVQIIGNTIIDADVFIGKGASVCNSQLLNNTQIGENTKINNAIINNSIVGENNVITNAFVDNSILKNNVTVNAFSCIKNKSIICDNVQVDFNKVIDCQKIEK